MKSGYRRVVCQRVGPASVFISMDTQGTKCHQRIVRERAAMLPDPDIQQKREAASTFANASVREITRAQAKEIILRYEYLGTLPAQSKYFVGLIFTHPGTKVEYLGGVAVFGSTAGRSVPASICGKDHAHEVLTLVRGACVPWADHDVVSGGRVHTGAAASYLISHACKLISQRHDKHIFVAYADSDAFEVGQVYQSSNWKYVGKGGTPTIYKRGDRDVDSRTISQMTRDRVGVPRREYGKTQEEIDAWVVQMKAEGKVVKGGRSYPYLQKMTREEAKAILIAQCGGQEPVQGVPKHRYVTFVGDRRKVRELERDMKLKVYPYPKRKRVEEAKAA